MKDAVYEKVKKYIDEKDMIAKGDLVVAGVSGGADSVCLLHMLRRLRTEKPFRLTVVHVDHGLREEAGEDAAFVGKLCEDWELPYILREVDAAAYASLHKLSTEEAGRQLRYQAFEEALAEQKETRGRSRIAVAHNAQDRAETMLFHLFRGSGLKGFSSIRPVREAVIRPLLQLSRAEIEAYLKAQGLSWREDHTNGEDAYARNRIRHHILSYAEQEICSGAAAHMGELADLLAETEDYLSRETEKLYKSCLERTRDAMSDGVAAGRNRELALRLDRLKHSDPVMQKRVLLRALETVIPYRKDISSRHIEGLLCLMEKGGSGSLSLPCGIRAYKEYDTLRFGGEAERENAPWDVFAVEVEKEALAGGDALKIPFLKGSSITFTLWEKEAIPEGSLFNKKEQNIPENRYTKWFDYDKITTALLLRPKKEGDYLTIDDALHRQSLKRYLINEKVPKEKRDSLFVLAEESHVLWVPGYRTSSAYHVSGETKRVLEVYFGDHRRTDSAGASEQSDKGENDGGKNRSTVYGSGG